MRTYMALLGILMPCWSVTSAFGIELNVPAQYATIQQAIDAASAGDEVVIATGTYTGDGNRDIDFHGKAITVRSTDPNDPNVVEATIIDCQASQSDPHRGFYFHSGEGADSVVAGLTITNGNAPAPASIPESAGGGVCCISGSLPGACPTISRCIFRNNKAIYGGAIHCRYSNPTIDSCTITDNYGETRGTIQGSGGGIQSGEGANPLLVGCTITDNQAGRGGGVYCHANPSIKTCNISDNSADDLGGGICLWTNSSALIDKTQIVGNSATNWGGGIYAKAGSPVIAGSTIRANTTEGRGAGIVLVDCDSPAIRQCTISDNTSAHTGGGIRTQNSDTTICNCVITGNTAQWAGGIFVGYGGSQAIINSLIADNTATIWGGGIRIWDMTDLTIRGCSIVSNSAGDQGGGIASSNSGGAIDNCIVWGNSSQEGDEVAIQDGARTLSWAYCDVQGADTGIHCGSGCSVVWGTGNIDADPCFANPAGPDGDPNTWADNDYHLSAGSPCIDTGDPGQDYTDQTDVDGQPRLYGQRVDMGSDEWVFYTLSVAVTGQHYGRVIIDPNQPYYEPNSVVSLTASGLQGGTFVGWSGDVPVGAETDNPLRLTMDADKGITATFQQGLDTYTLTTNVDGNGHVDPSGGTFSAGTMVSLAATADKGWYFVRWQGDLTGVENPATVRMDRNRTITALFEADQQQYTLATSVVGNGSVEPTEGTYASGAEVSLTARPAEGWHFVSWDGDLSGTDNPAVVTMKANRTVSAIFAQDQSEYVLVVTTQGEGSVSPSEGTFQDGTEVQLTATAAMGWRFVAWLGDVPSDQVGENPLTLTMDRSRVVTARFIPVDDPVSPPCFSWLGLLAVPLTGVLAVVVRGRRRTDQA